MSKHETHRRVQSGIPAAPPSEDIEGQLDRLNKALMIVMNEIEVSSCSRNPSRVSVNNQETLNVEDLQSPSFHSEEHFFPDGFEEKIEELLVKIDRLEMVIEDYQSEEVRRADNPNYEICVKKLEKENKELREKLSVGNHCNHDLNRIRKEVWLQVKMQKNEQNEKERRNFEEKLEALDNLKEDYQKKRAEIMSGMEKLRLKEEILNQKEKDIRAQRLAFDRHKFMWESQNGMSDAKNFQDLTPSPSYYSSSHQRANSFGSLASISKTNDSSYSPSPDKGNEEPKPKQLPISIHSESNSSENKPELLKSLQNELKSLENELKNKANDLSLDNSRLELKIDQIKNKIATIRGEIAISESTKATKIISSMVVSIKRETTRDENLKRSDLIEQINKKLTSLTPRLPSRNLASSIPIKPKPLDSKVLENNLETTTRRIFFSDGPEKLAINIKGDREEISKCAFDSKKKYLFEKEKELIQKEAFLQQTWMRIPGAKELIENVNLTLSKLNCEKLSLEKERDEFEKEKIEWIRNKEKNKGK